jgi:hypothetical protein
MSAESTQNHASFSHSFSYAFFHAVAGYGVGATDFDRELVGGP